MISLLHKPAMGALMTEFDRELNDLLAKRLEDDVRATAALQKHFEEARVVAGAFRGNGSMAGNCGFVRVDR